MSKKWYILLKVYEIRREILFNSSTLEIWNIFKDNKLFDKVEDLL